MRHFSRTYIAAFLFAATLATAGTAVLTGPTADQKRELVRHALEQQGVASEDPVLMNAAGRAQVVSAIDVVGGDTPSVIVKVTGLPPFEYQSIENGCGLAVDFHDTLNAMAVPVTVPKGSGALKAVSAELSALEPQFVTRVVLTFSKPCEPRFTVEDGCVRIALAPNSAAKPNTAAARVHTLLAQAETHERRIRIEHSALIEKLTRASQGDADRINDLETALAAAGETLQEAKADLLHADLEAAVPGETIKRVAGGVELARTIEEKDKALQQDRKESEQLIAQREDEVRGFVEACNKQLEKVRQRSSYDTGALRDLDKRLAEGATVEENDKALDLLTQKITRAQEAETAGVARMNEALDAGITAYAQSLDALSQRIAGRQQEMFQALLANTPAQPAQQADDSSVVLAKLNEEVKRFKSGASAPITLKAVPDPQLDLGTPTASPSAALGHLATGFGVVSSVTTGQAESDAPVPADAPAADPAAGSPEPAAGAPAEEAAPAAAPAPDAVPAEAAAPEAPAPQAPAPEAEPPAPAVEPQSVVIAAPTPEEPAAPEAAPVDKVGTPDALNEPVNLDLREMELSNFVALLAKKAGINVIAGTELTGTVTASIKNVPLRQALEMVLRMHDLGVVEEEGVYRIVPYATAQAAERTMRMITLVNGNVDDIKMTLDSVLMNSPNSKAISIATNPNTNVIIISGPADRVQELADLATSLDVSKPVVPTVTEAIKLNYAEPEEVQTMIKGMLTKESGQAAVDLHGRQIVVTDLPAVVEQVRKLVKDVDIPVKQVAVESMVVNAVLSDSSQTGTEWLLNSVRRRNTRGEVIGSLQDAGLQTNLGNVGTSALDAGLLTFNVLSSHIDLEATIAAEVSSKNAEILANPKLVIVENETGEISIVQDYPYQEITQTTQGPPVATTNFKPIGVTMEVTPRVTHTNEIIAELKAKQSSVSGLTETGVPIEDKREAGTTLNVKDGQTIFIGGLRNRTDRLEVSKIPVLGDVPVLNFLFRNTQTEKVNTDLMIFMTCHVLGQHLPDLSPEEQENYDKLGSTPEVPDSQRAMFRSFVKPGEMRDPAWKWRRAK